MAEKQGGFLPPGVHPEAGDKEFRKGQKAIDAAKGSGERARLTQQQAAEKAGGMAQEATKEFEREGGDPEKLQEVGKKIRFYRRLRGLR